MWRASDRGSVGGGRLTVRLTETRAEPRSCRPAGHLDPSEGLEQAAQSEDDPAQSDHRAHEPVEPQVQGRGVRSTASLASLRPVPVVARYRLIAWILRPGPVRPVGNARGVEEHDEDDKRQSCDSLGREPSSVAFARSGKVCTNLSGPNWDTETPRRVGRRGVSKRTKFSACNM